MTITLNGESRTFSGDGCSVIELIDKIGLANHPVLVELDGQALLRKEFAERQVTEGAQVEIVRMVAGG